MTFSQQYRDAAVTARALPHHADRPPLDAQWARIGGGFTVRPAQLAVNVERLIVSSARSAPADARLFWVMTSWMAVHAKLVNMRQLSRQLDLLRTEGATSEEAAIASAAMGAAFEVAQRLGGATAKAWKGMQRHCEPLLTPRPLFDVTARQPLLARVAREEGLEEFAVWGLWQRQITDKRDAIRSVVGVLETAPEFRVRVILGADLEASILDEVRKAPQTLSKLADATLASRAAVHDAVASLVARGFVAKDSSAYRTIIRIIPAMAAWLEQYPTLASTSAQLLHT